MEIQSDTFQREFTTALATVLDVPVSAVVIGEIVPANPISRKLEFISTTEDDILLTGFMVTYTVTKSETTLIALTTAINNSKNNVESNLNIKGYARALLGYPLVSDSTPYVPTSIPTSVPFSSANVDDINSNSPLVYIVVSIAAALLIIAIIIAIKWGRQYAYKESVITKINWYREPVQRSRSILIDNRFS